VGDSKSVTGGHSVGSSVSSVLHFYGNSLTLLAHSYNFLEKSWDVQ